MLIVVTPEAEKKIANIQQIINSTKYSILQPENIPKPNKKNKKGEIVIYDVSKHTNTRKKIIPINNHINKTGSNPLRNKKEKTINFYDITQIYNQKNKGKIAECFGKKKRKTPTKREYISTYYLCHYTIWAKIKGYRKISAFIIQ